MALAVMILQKICSYKLRVSSLITLLFFLTISNVYASTKKVFYSFDFQPEGVYVRSCIAAAEKNQRWFLADALFTNKKEFNIKIETPKAETTFYPNCQYVNSTNEAGEQVCVTYMLEYGPRAGQYQHDVTREYFAIFHHHLSIPDPKNEPIETFELSFNWKNFNQVINGSFGKFKQHKEITLSAKQLDNLYLVSGFKSKLVDNSKLYFLPQHRAIIRKLESKIRKLTKKLAANFKPSTKFGSVFIFIRGDGQHAGTSGFALCDSKNSINVITLNDTQDKNIFLTHVLAHEYYHKIFGGCLIQRNARTQPEDSWFFEGFTEYFSTKSNAELGIWSLEHYKNLYNKQIIQYYTYTWPNTVSISDLYYTQHYERIANYDLGMMYAHYLNAKLVESSSGKLTLLGFIKFFIDEYNKNKDQYFTTAKFFDRLYSYSGIKFKDIETYRKEKSIFPDTILNGKLCLTERKVGIPKYSVDLFKMLKEFKYNDQKIVSYQIDPQNEDILHVETMDSNQTIHPFTFTPTLKLTKIPQYLECSKLPNSLLKQ